MPRITAKTPQDLRSLARSHTDMAVRVLAGVAQSPKAPAAARTMAAAQLLDRGWGKATQAISGEDGEEIRITIRQIVDAGVVATTQPQDDQSGDVQTPDVDS